MGLRAQNNPNASFEDPFVNTGKNAWKPYVAPFGIQASGGVISDWVDPGPGKVCPIKVRVVCQSSPFSIFLSNFCVSNATKSEHCLPVGVIT